MITEAEVKRMPLNQKLRIMEMIWEDLNRNEDTVESPSWHEDIVKEREKGLDNGEMTVSDWEKAKAGIQGDVA
ncbi:MAG: acyl-protein synthetase [Candidatus Electrothrix sp. GM3_4]|jgi:hypothetical protein|uniref:Putative addiction module component n=1 Tax=Candidatus Electrothrix aarhusensis TaxID=1859131 RepID=A0A3S3QNH1_9BACT|nr:acyl-protein synthetase [Candidatus Electrothrix sp. GM3_4]RWX42992.1 putative addiction module component [Candidatus Electrothrix aarhusensis]